MAIQTPPPISIFAPNHTTSRRATTEIRFSRWNNANAEKYQRPQRAQKEIEDEIRLQRRFESASKIAYDNLPVDIDDSVYEFKSVGTPSSPSRPSIAGKSSKYSKTPRNPNPNSPCLRGSGVYKDAGNGVSARHDGVLHRRFSNYGEKTNPNPNSRSPKPNFIVSRVSEDARNELSAVSDPKFSIYHKSPNPNGLHSQRAISRFFKVSEDVEKGISVGEGFEHCRNPNPKNPNPDVSHPGLGSFSRVPAVSGDNVYPLSVVSDGVSYRIPNAPFEFQYSYTETPKAKPLRLREPPYLPFGPSSIARPWTGRAPHLGSDKKVPELNLFSMRSSVIKYGRSRKEILGEPLTEDEIEQLVRGCLKSSRQLNMGRDGLTHNMLDNIHAHWKWRKVCRIKCRGVCTIDMENIYQQLEEKTGGKIIYCKGGVIYLFRGRNYNSQTRLRFPLMLWKPAPPVYPRLVQRAPEGLSLEEASHMRKRGRQLPPICKLGKNGVYADLVKHVNEAFEACDLVRINCEGMKGSDYRKIGAKLKDLVPCVLISLEHKHILMWSGRDWKSSLPKPEDDFNKTEETTTDSAPANLLAISDKSSAGMSSNQNESTHGDPAGMNKSGSLTSLDGMGSPNESAQRSMSAGNFHMLVAASEGTVTCDDLAAASDGRQSCPSERGMIAYEICTEGILQLWKQAIECGSALVVDDDSLDDDIVYERAAALAQTAPSGPVFMRSKKLID